MILNPILSITEKNRMKENWLYEKVGVAEQEIIIQFYIAIK